jgi:DNA mismatch endonuclease (patch repair protein)
MVDHISPERRSWLMSRVPSKHTAPEIRVRRAAHALGLRFRLHRKDLPGRPDLVFPKFGIAMFVHGCFWHRHGDCPKATIPKSREDFWREKFTRNVARDLENENALTAQGWRVSTIWECETRDANKLNSILTALFGGTAGNG